MSTSLPEEFTARLSSQKYIEKETLIEALSSVSPVSIRLNSAKWENTPALGDKVPWCATGYWLPRRPVFTLDPLFHAGCYYVQEASSMFLEQVIRQAGGDADGLRILDLCAAPGGKTTHLSALAGSDSVIVANEVIRGRASVLSENVTRWGIPNVIVTGSDASSFANLRGYFDIVVVDAPCSGEGMFRETPVRNEWSLSACGLCASRQWRIITDVWPSLKEGGILVYSTCTFNPDENEKIIDRLIKTKKCSLALPVVADFTDVIPVPDELNPMGYGFYPGRIRGEGFFISALRKEESEKGILTKAGKRSGKRTDPGLVNKALAMAITEDEYIEASGDEVTHLPLPKDEYHMLNEKVRILKGGTSLFRIKGSDLVPHHDLAMSLIFRRESVPVLNAGEEEALRYLSRDSDFATGAGTRGWLTVMHRNIPLGFAKNLGSRINNYYPQERRIRMDISRGASKVL